MYLLYLFINQIFIVMKLTNDDCITMYNALDAVLQPKFEDIKDLDDRDDYIFHVDFVHAISYNKRKLKDVVESLQEANKNTNEYDEYLKEREKILERYAAKNDDGTARERFNILPNGMRQRIGFIVPDLSDPDSDVAKEIDKLEKKNKTHIDVRKKQSEDFKQTLKDTTEVNIKMVNWSRIPKGLQPYMMDGIMFMINESSSMPEKKDEKKK